MRCLLSFVLFYILYSTLIKTKNSQFHLTVNTVCVKFMFTFLNTEKSHYSGWMMDGWMETCKTKSQYMQRGHYDRWT